MTMASQTPRSMLDKLARCQQILGYTFRDVSILQESLTLRVNKRMATAGDTYVQVALVDRWYSLPNRTSQDFAAVKRETLSNHNLANVGFNRGLYACTLPLPCGPDQHQQMADTVEAILAAVYRDALFENSDRKATNWKEFERVVARLGINHHLIASAVDLRWALSPMRTTRKIPLQFFSRGHHLDWARTLAQASGKFHNPSVPAAQCRSDVRASFNGPAADGNSVSRLVLNDLRHDENRSVTMGPVTFWTKARSMLPRKPRAWAELWNPSQKAQQPGLAAQPKSSEIADERTEPALVDGAAPLPIAAITVDPPQAISADIATTDQMPEQQHEADTVFETLFDVYATDETAKKINPTKKELRRLRKQSEAASKHQKKQSKPSRKALRNMVREQKAKLKKLARAQKAEAKAIKSR